MGAESLTKLHLTHYMKTYNEYLSGRKYDEMVLLELGIAGGLSLLHWRDFLPNSQIIGLDIDAVEVDDPTGRIKMYQGEQQDRELLDRIASEVAPAGFDVIIDDASHIGQLARISFWHLFEHHLKPGGLYFIEDWGTGYFKYTLDGKLYTPRPVDFTWYEKALNSLIANPVVQRSAFLHRAVRYVRRRAIKRAFPSHQRGMVGIVKELIDECGSEDITNEKLGGRGPKRFSRIEWMRVSLGMVIVKKPDRKPEPVASAV